MATSTRKEPSDHDRPRLASHSVQGKAQAIVRCRLCSEKVALESNFRPMAVLCPHCGLKFVFDPQEEPLPVRGMRLRWSDVIEAQRRGRTGDGRHRRHAAHVAPPPVVLQPRTNYLAWLGTIAIAVAGFIAFVGLLRR